MAAVMRAARCLLLSQPQQHLRPCHLRLTMPKAGNARPPLRVYSSHSEQMTPIKIVAIAGSFRKASSNQGLIRAAVEISKDICGIEIEPLQISHLPFINTDLEVDGHFPAGVEEFRAKVLKADSVLIASPEYNYSFPGVLKNAIDWASRPPNCWADKTAALMSAGGHMGGGKSQYHLRQVGVYIDLHFVNRPEVFVRIFEPPIKFDKDGNLVHEDTRERIKELLLALQKFTLRLQKKC